MITGFKQINAKFATILQPHKGLRISDADRRRLVAVHRRVECLIQPLNFCVLWAKDQDSCIQPMIHYAYDLVQSVTDFLDKVKFTTDELDPFTRVLDMESSQKVDYFLRELEFGCNSVSLAVSITKSSVNQCASESGRISPSALLKASARILEMSHRSGDLLAMSGTLFRRSEQGWKPEKGDTVLKVCQFRSIDPSDSPYLVRLSLADGENMNFPIHTALSFRVSTVKTLGLPIPDLIDSAVIVWQLSETSKRRILHRNPSGNMNEEFSMDSSDEDTILIRGAAEVPPALRPRISSTHLCGPESGSEYAFVLPPCSSMSALDVVYIARLCVMEAIRQPPLSDASNLSSPRPTVYHALHLEASDDALYALLLDARFISDEGVQEVEENKQPEIDILVSELQT